MATKITINGKTTSIPGAYSILKSGISNPPAQLPYGNVLIVDTGAYGAGWGGGSGIAGTVTSGKEAITAFDNVTDFRNFVKGGYWWLLGKPLFKPYKNLPGVSKIYWVSARATTQGTITLAAQGGTVTFKPLEEGLITNGTLDTGTSVNLTKGYGIQLLASAATQGKFIVKFFLGTYRGFDSINNTYYENTELASIPNNFLTTPDLSSAQDLYNWMLSSTAFASMFGSPTYTNHPAIATSSLASGGSGYAVNNTFTIAGGTTLATGIVNTIGAAESGVATSSLVTGGAGYAINDTFTVASGSTLATGRVLTIKNGAINANTLGIGGAGYAINDTFTVASGSTLATGRVLTVGGGGAVLTYSIVTSGAGYTTGLKTTTATSGIGTGLTINVTSVANGVTLTYSILTTGAGYSTGTNPCTSTSGVGSGMSVNVLTLTTTGPVVTYTITNPNAGYAVASAIATSATSGVGTGLTINILTIGTANFVNADLVANPGYVLSTGATETYNDTYVTQVLASIGSLDNTMILADDAGDNSTSDNNAAILDYILNTAKYDQHLFIGGGNTSLKFMGDSDPTTSDGASKFYNDQHVVIVHGAPKIAKAGGGYNQYDSLYKAAIVMGRLAGLAPQDSVTFKGLDIDGEVHSLLYPTEYEYALDNGILATVYDNDLGIFCTLQGIDTVQSNDNVLNVDGTTFSIQLMRIEIQMNRDMAYNAKRDLFGSQTSGPNRTTISEADVITFMTKFLKQKMTDGLIVRFGNLTATLTGIDTFTGNYEFVPNYEVTKLIITGTMLAA